MRAVNQLDEAIWRDFVDHHPAGQIFHTPEMYRVFSATPGHRPTLWAVVDRHDRPLALFLPVEITLKGGPFYRLTTRAVSYADVLTAPGDEGLAALDLLLANYRQAVGRRILFTEIRNLSDASALQPVLQKHGFAFEGHLNYLIDLTRPPEEILQSFGKRTRKRIRKGLRDNIVQVSEVTRAADLPRWYSPLQETYQHARVPLAERRMFENAFETLYNKGMVKFLIAEVDGHVAACSVELVYRDIIYGWYGGSDRRYSAAYPNEMLMWHILRWGAENQFRVYDFGGAGKPDEEYGVRDFKAKFGGELVNFGRSTCVHNPLLLQFSKMGYGLFRRLMALKNRG